MGIRNNLDLLVEVLCYLLAPLRNAAQNLQILCVLKLRNKNTWEYLVSLGVLTLNLSKGNVGFQKLVLRMTPLD